MKHKIMLMKEKSDRKISQNYLPYKINFLTYFILLRSFILFGRPLYGLLYFVY